MQSWAQCLRSTQLVFTRATLEALQALRMRQGHLEPPLLQASTAQYQP
jgi:hypothetical protein